MELTEVEFWDDYWANCRLPSEVDPASSFDRCLSRELAKRLAGVSGDVLEIGCAPGKWLAFLTRNFGFRASGIEYSSAGMRATLRNFELLGLSAETILAGDFFALEPEPRFDLVMSFGFIEHFDDPDSVVERHLAWVKPGGKLVLGVPNFRGIYRHLQQILDPDILAKHNLDIMTPAYFQGLPQRLPMYLSEVDYIGSFEPSLPIAKPGLGRPMQFLVKSSLRAALSVRRFPLFDGINHRAISSYILAIFTKNV